MFKVLTIIFIIFQSNVTFAQLVLVKQDGKQVQISKQKLRNDSVYYVTTSPRQKYNLPIREVLGYYDLGSKTMYYLKPSEAPNDSSNFEFIERIVTGEINVYQRVVSTYVYSQYGGASKTTIYLYVEKKDDFFEVLETNTLFGKKAEKMERFKRLIEDDTEILKKFNSPVYKHKLKNIIELITEYNLRNHQAFIAKNKFDVVLMRRDKKQSNESAIMFIDGNKYSLGVNDTLHILIPANYPAKACIETGSKNECSLIISSPYFKKYYEVFLNDNLEASLEEKEAKYAEFYIPILLKK